MARPTKPIKPFNTDKKRIERLEYLVFRMCETFKIEYDLE